MKIPVLNVPDNISDLIDVLGAMLLRAPKFADKTGYLPFRDLDYSFRELNEGLVFNRKKLGDERCLKLTQMSDQMRALFEADPDNKTGDTTKGCHIIQDMLEIVEQSRRKA